MGEDRQGLSLEVVNAIPQRLKTIPHSILHLRTSRHSATISDGNLLSPWPHITFLLSQKNESVRLNQSLVTRTTYTQDDTTWTGFPLRVCRKLPLCIQHHIRNFHFLWSTVVHHYDATKGLLQRIFHWMQSLDCEGEIFMSNRMLSTGHQCIPYLNTYCSCRTVWSVPCSTPQQFFSASSRRMWPRRAGLVFYMVQEPSKSTNPFKLCCMFHFFSKLGNTWGFATKRVTCIIGLMEVPVQASKNSRWTHGVLCSAFKSFCPSFLFYLLITYRVEALTQSRSLFSSADMSCHLLSLSPPCSHPWVQSHCGHDEGLQLWTSPGGAPKAGDSSLFPELSSPAWNHCSLHCKYSLWQLCRAMEGKWLTRKITQGLLAKGNQ